MQINMGFTIWPSSATARGLIGRDEALKLIGPIVSQHGRFSKIYLTYQSTLSRLATDVPGVQFVKALQVGRKSDDK